MMFALSMTGENPSQVWIKTASNPIDLADEELAQLKFMLDCWWNFHNRKGYLESMGLTDVF